MTPPRSECPASSKLYGLMGSQDISDGGVNDRTFWSSFLCIISYIEPQGKRLVLSCQVSKRGRVSTSSLSLLVLISSIEKQSSSRKQRCHKAYFAPLASTLKNRLLIKLFILRSIKSTIKYQRLKILL
ncbi:MAG: hypothetical protein DSO07_01625 [Thermoproteota archaeon]|nr:MAG: hypothetical protein DSO07_01625 [Candidatus Korarchaeota archaeon]